MEEKKSARQAGSKVSQIANIFQGKPNNIKEEILAPVKTLKTRSSSSEKNEMESPSVTVMRTESHVTRFNNARALFEKLGEENRSRDRMIPLQSTKSASNILDLRSRSSSANSETRDTKSHDGSRSPSPNRNQLDKFSNSVPVLNANSANVKANGFSANSSVPDNNSLNERAIKLNGNDVMKCVLEERTKPSVMKKPEKPERKFNSKELIEKQRNWTSHFSKTRSSRYNSDPSKTDVKLAVSNGSKESGDKISSASRSASFNNKIRSPPTSPPPPPDVTRRPNLLRRERPASVIPTTTPSKKEYTSLTSPVKTITSPTRREKTTSLMFSKDESPTRSITTNTYRVTKPHFKRDEKEKNNKENDSENKSDNRTEYVGSPTKLASRSPSQDSLQPAASNITINKPATEEKETSRENLSATSGSLSSLSPPSSPSRVKTENEKQENESNEKFDIPATSQLG